MPDRQWDDDGLTPVAGTSPAPEAATETAPADGAGTPEPGEPSADEAREALKRERDELFDLLLRKTAEFENYRKRVDRERRDALEHAAADIIEEIVPVLDDFERALAHEPGGDEAAYRQGIALIYRQLVELLRKRGVREIEAVGRPFDPNLHQAVAYEETGEHPEGEVVEQYRKGYLLKDQLLRPSMVKVAKGSA